MDTSGKLYRDLKIEFHNGKDGYILCATPLYKADNNDIAWGQRIHGVMANGYSGDLVYFKQGKVIIGVEDTPPPDSYYCNEDGVFEESNYFTRPVFNIELTDTHTYYVGEFGIWVHDTNYSKRRYRA